MNQIEAILKSSAKPKEKISALAELLLHNPQLADEFIMFFEAGSIADQGNCLSALALVTEKNPFWVAGRLNWVIDCISDKAPRVKWEAATVVGNSAAALPFEAAAAVPALITNASNSGTVVRWSAAFALTSIARANPEIRTELIPFLKSQAAAEQNNGVRKIYEKALKFLAS